MNVLALLQTSAYRLGITPPSAYNSNLQLLHLLYQVSEELRNTRMFPQQKRTQTLTLIAGTYDYAIAADFYSGILETQYDQTNKWNLVGPLSDSEFNYRLYGPGGATDGKNAYRVFGPTAAQISTSKMLVFDPNTFTPATASFDYITGSTFYTSGGSLSTTLKETAAANSDIPMFDDDLLIAGLKAAYKESKGLDFSADRATFEKLIEAAETRFCGSVVGSFINRGEPKGAWSKGGILTYSF